jgi:plasmid stabilization system protein ParE
MSRVIWTDAADAARDFAIEYIARSNLSAALTPVDEIRHQTERLLKFPYLGKPSKVKGARELLINRTHFKVVYCILDGNIHIFRFYHTAQKS